MQSDDVSLEILCPPQRTRKVALTARIGDDVFTDRLDIAIASARVSLVDQLLQRWPALQSEECRRAIEARLEQIAAQHVAAASTRNEEARTPEEPDREDLLRAMPEDVKAEADAMLRDPLLIKQIVNDGNTLGVAGESRLVAIEYLTGTSRLLRRPASVIVKGPSASGKSFVIERTASMFPPEAVIRATRMTPQALFHMPRGSLRHQFIVAGERSRLENDESAEATRALREMISSGKLSKLMPIKQPGGTIETVLIEQEGPIAFIESTTLSKIFDEDANRCILVETDERPDQTRRILRKIGEGAARPEMATSCDCVVLRHHALQRMLEPHVIRIPYATRLGELFTTDRVEARRAFSQLLTMIEAVTLLHQRQRERDPDGCLLATTLDYRLAAYLLARPIAVQLGGRVSDSARRFYARLRARFPEVFTTREAIALGGASDRAIRGWLGELCERELLELIEESRGRHPATWRVNSGAIEDEGDAAFLPTMEDLFPEPGDRHSDKIQAAVEQPVTPEVPPFAGDSDNNSPELPAGAASSGERCLRAGG